MGLVQHVLQGWVREETVKQKKGFYYIYIFTWIILFKEQVLLIVVFHVSWIMHLWLTSH